MVQRQGKGFYDNVAGRLGSGWGDEYKAQREGVGFDWK